MGLKKIFQKKEPTEAQLREDLTRAGISTKSANTRQEKFGAFRNYAQEKASNRAGYAPVSNPYAQQHGAAPGSNPYAAGEAENGQQSDHNPYGQPPPPNGNNPYGQSNGSNPYGQARTGNRDPYAQPQPPQQLGQYSRRDPYATRTQRRGFTDTESVDLNAIPSSQMAHPNSGRRPVRRQAMHDDDDLNAIDDDVENLNLDIDVDLPEQEQVNSEDEEVEAIKQDIRFVKQESVASTRNTLRMAQEADASGSNTLGMLGSQSERLFNAEQNLLLADTQTKIADEKVKELNRLNRSIFIPAYGNPFNKKSRLRQQEERIKSAKMQEKYMKETNRSEMYASEQRIKAGLNNSATNNEIHEKYRGERDLAAAKRYQFENDSEDDEMEKEIGLNLDQIGQYAKKLHGLANTIGQEVDSQNQRLRKIEEDADRLDINVHMNNTRLSNIR